MVGLMQIMIYLFCIYLVYKGIEIFQIAFVSRAIKPVKVSGIVLGVICIVGAVVASDVAIFLTEGMVSQIGNMNFPR